MKLLILLLSLIAIPAFAAPGSITVIGQAPTSITVNTNSNGLTTLVFPGPQGAQGVQGLQGDVGPQGIQGNAGVSAGTATTFSTATTASGITNGQVRFNSTDYTSVTVIYVYDNDRNGNYIGLTLNNLEVGDSIDIKQEGNDINFATYEVVSNIDNGNYHTLTVSYNSHNETFTNGQSIRMQHAHRGIQGATGLTGPAGAGDVISTGNAGGQTIKGGTAAGETLTLSSTANATKGKINFGTSVYDEVNNRLGVGTIAPQTRFQATINTGGDIARFSDGGQNSTMVIGSYSANEITFKANMVSGKLAFATNNSSTPSLTINSAGVTTATQYAVSALNTAPASATATCTTGEMRFTATYHYICQSTNSWMRSAIYTTF